MGSLKPDWMSEDWEVALRAVRDETDPLVLARIASEARLREVRHFATRRILYEAKKVLGEEIGQSGKGRRFFAFFEDNADVIYEVACRGASFSMTYLKNRETPFYVPDYLNQRWVVNPLIGSGAAVAVQGFFQTGSGERNWTAEETNAIRHLVDDFMGKQSQFSRLKAGDPGFASVYRRIPPAGAVRGRRPY